MKSIFIAVLTFLLLCGSANIYSQTKHKQGKFSVSLQTGAFVPFGDASDAYKTGFNTGFDVAYKVKNNLDVFFILNYNFLSFKSSSLTNATPHLIDVSIGSRYFLASKSNNQVFGEAGLGLYSFGTSSYNTNTSVLVPHIDPKSGDTTYTTENRTTTTPSSSSSDFGINLGIGDIYQISNSVGIYLKSDFHLVFTSGSSTTFMGIYGGVKFRF